MLKPIRVSSWLCFLLVKSRISNFSWTTAKSRCAEFSVRVGPYIQSLNGYMREGSTAFSLARSVSPAWSRVRSLARCGSWERFSRTNTWTFLLKRQLFASINAACAVSAVRMNHWRKLCNPSIAHSREVQINNNCSGVRTPSGFSWECFGYNYAVFLFLA